MEVIIMAVFVVGDTHGFHEDHFRFSDKVISMVENNLGRSLNRNDYLIIAGDFGVIWENEPDSHEIETLDKLEALPWTTMFIDGNHENFARLRVLPEADGFGGKISLLRDHIVYLRQRGQIYEIDGHKIWCFGGGTSVDRDTVPRVKNVSWWKEEEATDAEYIYGIEQLATNNWEVDFAITHAAPQEALNQLRLPPLQ
jgi:hypothetical protein